MKHGTAGILCLTAMVFALACTHLTRQAKPVADTEIGLARASVFGTADPIVAKPVGLDPGENQRLGAYFSGSPPLIPHTTEEYLPLTASANNCLGCHDLKDIEPAQRPEGVPPIPDSHYADVRTASGQVAPAVSGKRYFCMQCHTTQTDAKPLVTNTYRP